MRARPLAALAILGIAFLLLAGCGHRPAAPDAARPAEAPLQVSVAEAVARDVERRVDVTGTLAAWEEALVASEADGRLQEVDADLGDRVKKGDPLAKVAPEELALRLAQAEADFAAADASYRRVKELIAKESATPQQADEEGRRFAIAKAAAELARKKYGDATLRAPFDGAVARRLVNAGDFVRTGAPAFQVVRVTPLKFRGDVPERYAGDVRKGDAVLAYTEATGAEPLKGEIVRVGPAVTADTRSFTVEARIENPGGAVKPGSFARLSILTGTTEKALLVPEASVFAFAGNPRVFVVKDGKASERTVETGGRTGGMIAVTQGLAAGEAVATTGMERLADGQAVTVRAEAAR